MQNTNETFPVKDGRTHEYNEANDRMTNMSDMDKCMNKLEAQGYTSQYKIIKGKLHNLGTKKTYKAKDVKAANFYRFEGNSDPDDMSILYAIETSDGSKGTLVDAYGMYSDDDTAEFLNQIEINKKVKKG